MFSDLSRPPLNATELRRNLTFFSSLDVVAVTGSTNADLVSVAGDRGADRKVLIAESQTKGRGRHGREWVSPPQAQIAMSMLLRIPEVPASELGWIPLLTGIAVTDALRSVAEVDAVLKWPNDLLINDKKVAGILAEMAGVGKDAAVVVGLGLNVSLKADELPVPEATSLVLEEAECTDRTTLIRAILRSFGDWYTRWENADFTSTALAPAYAERCSTIGANVRAELPSGDLLQGRALGVDSAGRLQIDTDKGIATVTAGDVRHVRRTD
ncbi:biotin--[acetyl-CoA-carboxylase] ligase [Smaragdicoccus niigatensis]|uniref:biotin--[acetyl-CoA-carboxylase] ligase n=1 Tax=Smaragdicoccus niigatensis TaxID=359359 RepID=UPI0004759BDD|nr:biotin--[acetyl-CoA-carboxylase] ligase [Smaragdicoccus niigatensis]